MINRNYWNYYFDLIITFVKKNCFNVRKDERNTIIYMMLLMIHNTFIYSQRKLLIRLIISEIISIIAVYC